MKIRDDVTAVQQLSEVRLFILRNARTCKIRFLDLVMEKLKTESQYFYLPEDENTNKNNHVILSLCSELLDLLTARFEEAVGPFPLEQRFVKYVVPKLLFIFATLTIQNKLSDIDYKEPKTVTCEIEGHYIDFIAKYLASEWEIHVLKTEKLQRLHEWKIQTAEENKCEEEQHISVEHEEDLTDGNAHKDDSKHIYTLHDFRAKQHRESKCGSIISEKDVADNDLCQTSSLKPVNVGDDLEIDKSRKTSEIHETDEMDKCFEYFDKMDESRNCNCSVDYSSEDLETAPYDHNETLTNLDREPIKLTEDTCHVTNISKHDQLNRNNNFKYQQYLERKIELTGEDKCEEEQYISVGHEVDLTDGNAHGVRNKPNIHDIRAKRTPIQAK